MASCSRPASMAAGREGCPCSIRLFGATILRTGDAQEPAEGVEAEEKRSGKSIQCPRCRSQDTKFCYFNNYNVNQPRHFCKACQRYWTAGGALRNVPVGAGRRRAKPPCFGPERLTDGFFLAGSQSETDRPLGWHAAVAAACDGFQEALKRRRGEFPCSGFD